MQPLCCLIFYISANQIYKTTVKKKIKKIFIMTWQQVNYTFFNNYKIYRYFHYNYYDAYDFKWIKKKK